MWAEEVEQVGAGAVAAAAALAAASAAAAAASGVHTPVVAGRRCDRTFEKEKPGRRLSLVAALLMHAFLFWGPEARRAPQGAPPLLAAKLP